MKTVLSLLIETENTGSITISVSRLMGDKEEHVVYTASPAEDKELKFADFMAMRGRLEAIRDIAESIGVFMSTMDEGDIKSSIKDETNTNEQKP